MRRMRIEWWVPAGMAVTLVAAVSLWAPRADAVSTRTFALDSSKDLAAGELDGTAVHSDGSVTSGAQVRRLDLPEVAVAWSFARGDGGRVYVGTGHDGKIFEVRADRVSLLAETEQLLVASLAVGSDGTIYAGTLPEGRIYKVSRGGQIEELARPEGAEHVWALAWDPRRRRLFAGTGPEGKIYAIDGAGRIEEYYDAEAGHVMSLALDGDGTLYAGTSDEAVVVRLRGPGQAEVVHDFPGNEVTAVAVHEGELAVAANEFPDPPRVRGGSSESKRKGQAPRPKPGKGQLWRVGSDGRAEKVYENDKGHFTSVQIGQDGTIFAGVGNDGRIVRVTRDRRTSTWVDVDERQVLAVGLLGRDPIFLTGDTGAVYRIVPGRPQEAVWTSKVLDAEFRARWGQMTWRVDGAVEMQTRSGNTSEPDPTWSAWSAPVDSPGPVRSAPARFLQVRARFARDPDAVLRAVRLYYLPQNQRAVVSSVRLKGEKKDDDGQDKLPDPSTKYKLTWKVDNPDKDELRYRLRFRQEAQSVWRSILREDEQLTKDEYEWETSGVPDGWYVIEVEASDELANPEGLTLRATAQSEPILIDNHAPTIEALRAQGRTVRGRALDTVGPIARLEYAVDGGEWHVFFPADHLLDTRREDFELDLSSLEGGPHIIAIRAYDAAGNPTTSELTLRTGAGP